LDGALFARAIAFIGFVMLPNLLERLLRCEFVACLQDKVRSGETPEPARETRALPEDCNCNPGFDSA
jgi:hypothetical protein